MGDPNLLRIEPEYTMQTVTERTGVPGHTIRSWERRHGFPVPERGDANQRLYSERDVHFISWIREQSERGQQVSASIRQLLNQGAGPRSTVDRPLRRSSDSIAARPDAGILHYSDRASPDQNGPRLDRLHSALDSLTSFEPGPFRQILRDRFAIEDPCAVVFDVILGAGEMLGAQRERHQIRASSWKYAHGWLRDQIVALISTTEPTNGRERVVGVRLIGSVDDLVLMAHLLEMARSGMDVTTFSLALTPSELIATVDEFDASIVLLAADDEVTAWEAAHAGRLVSQRQEPPRVGYCGAGFTSNPELAPSLSGVILRQARGAYRSLLVNRQAARVIEVFNG